MGPVRHLRGPRITTSSSWPAHRLNSPLPESPALCSISPPMLDDSSYGQAVPLVHRRKFRQPTARSANQLGDYHCRVPQAKLQNEPADSSRARRAWQCSWMLYLPPSESPLRSDQSQRPQSRWSRPRHRQIPRRSAWRVQSQAASRVRHPRVLPQLPRLRLSLDRDRAFQRRVPNARNRSHRAEHGALHAGEVGHEPRLPRLVHVPHKLTRVARSVTSQNRRAQIQTPRVADDHPLPKFRLQTPTSQRRLPLRIPQLVRPI